MKESAFQKRLIKDLKTEFPGCIVLKNDAQYKQGIPDLSVFVGNKWAMLECKDEANASHQPNQDYYVSKADQMSYAKFIYPENREEVINGLHEFFGTQR